MSAPHNRDVIVIGASMGGIEALTTLVSQLPVDLAASVLVVQHTSEHSPGLLGEILDGAGPLRAAGAEDGSRLERGRIYVAPPDRHLLLSGDRVRVVFGPRENRSRPAIDPLFRTAAVSGRSRVVGVVLTGLLGDGAAGLSAVQRCGGVAVVQTPDDAAYPEMPRRALAAVPDAYQASLESMGALLVRLATERAPEPPPVPEVLRIEARLTEQVMNRDEGDMSNDVAIDWGQVPGRSTDFTCPDCSGALREIDDESVSRYRCRVGHAYSADDLLSAKQAGVEEVLWIALQTLQERVQMLESMAETDRSRGRSLIAGNYAARARETRAAAERLRSLITGLAE